MSEPNITPELIDAHGLKPDEYQLILDIIGREPTFTELGIFSAMWNEHCSYKSSKNGCARYRQKAHKSFVDRVKTQGSSILAMVRPLFSKWKATTTLPTSNPIRGRNRCRWYFARCLYHGRTPDCCDERPIVW